MKKTNLKEKLRLSGNFWLLSFKISYLCLPLFYETRNFKTGSWEIISANYQLSLPEYLSLLPELIL